MTITKPSLEKIREFTSRTGDKSWIPSIKGGFGNTFTLKGNNKDGTGSTGEINVLTKFKDDNEQDLNRFMLSLYCLRHSPFNFDKIGSAIDYSDNDLLFTRDLETFFTRIQTGKGENPASNGLTADIVRTYRGSKIDAEEYDAKGYLESVRYAKDNEEYQNNVAGVLGKVTYDSIIKNTLYRLLVKNNIINFPVKSAGETWVTRASKLEPDQFDFYIDESGGLYSRAFPVVCSIVRSESGKINSLKEKSDKFLSSKFLRAVKSSEDSINKLSSKEKDEIEIPQGDTGDSVYCFLYDFTKIIIKDPIVENDETIDLLKISLSILSERKTKEFGSLSEFKNFISLLGISLEDEFSSIDKNSFGVSLKSKHSKEVSFITEESEDQVTLKLERPFKAEIKDLAKSLESFYFKIASIFREEVDGENKNIQFEKYQKNTDRRITLHFDSFYNLLAVTSRNDTEETSKKVIEQNVPFKLEDYEVSYKFGDLTRKFFSKDETNLSKDDISFYNEGSFSYSSEIALTQDIVFVTDIFLKKVWENLDSEGKGLRYDSDNNYKSDSPLKINSLNILGKIEESPSDTTLTKDNYFINQSGRVSLVKDVVKTLRMLGYGFGFAGTGVSKISGQTLGHFATISPQDIFPGVTLDDFKSKLYYPILTELPSTPSSISSFPKLKAPKLESPENKNFLVNNIITSELPCYGDIVDSIDKAMDSEDSYEMLYELLKSLGYIGLPILLSLAQNKLAEELRKAIGKYIGDPSLLQCLALNAEDIKKMIMGYLDLLNNPEAFLDSLLQTLPVIPQIPPLEYFSTFDAEKELKRRLVQYVIKTLVKLLKDSVKQAIGSLMDICNSDSYLLTFLDNSLPGLKATPSGESPSGTQTINSGDGAALSFPDIMVNINKLISDSNIAKPDVVASELAKYFMRGDKSYSNEKVKRFFDSISNAVNASTMATLFNGAASFEDKSLILSWIKNKWTEDFYKIFDTQDAVRDLFLFLANYVDVNICYGIISASASNSYVSVCDPIDFVGSTALYLGNLGFSAEEVLGDIEADLSKSIDEICRLKFGTVFDVLTNGPSLLTSKLEKALSIGHSQTVNSTQTVNDELITQAGKIVINEKVEGFFSIKFGRTAFNKFSGKFYSYSEEEYKKGFEDKLKNHGNVGLKTVQASFDGYVRKLESFKDHKIIIKE